MRASFSNSDHCVGVYLYGTLCTTCCYEKVLHSFIPNGRILDSRNGNKMALNFHEGTRTYYNYYRLKQVAKWFFFSFRSADVVTEWEQARNSSYYKTKFQVEIGLQPCFEMLLSFPNLWNFNAKKVKKSICLGLFKKQIVTRSGYAIIWLQP